MNKELFKVGGRGIKISGFNFKKCKATKYLYGTGMYKYTRACETFDK